MAHAINWFEIPAKNLERAKAFYEAILGVEMILPFPDMKYAMFPADMMNGEIGGGLSEEEGFEPSQQGALIYLNDRHLQRGDSGFAGLSGWRKNPLQRIIICDRAHKGLHYPPLVGGPGKGLY